VAGFEPATLSSRTGYSTAVQSTRTAYRSPPIPGFGLAECAEEHLTSIATEIATEPTGTGCDENGPITLWRSRNTEEMSLSGMEQDELRPPLTNQRDAVLAASEPHSLPAVSSSRQPHWVSAARICAGIGATTRIGARFL
jgi:hypothetical protein